MTFAVPPLGADEEPGQGLPKIIRGNERFGAMLLERVHSEQPERNVVVSPISITITMAMIQHHSWGEEVRKEISGVFGWGESTQLAGPTRMLLAAFDEPRWLWIRNTFLFRSKDPKTGQAFNPFAPQFVASASKYFGMKFVNTGAANPSAEDLRGARKSVGTLPAVSPKNDVWISSGTHLRTAWRGNTFSMSHPFPGEFQGRDGTKRQVEMITSEVSQYPHAVTESFEAVVLSGGIAYMVAVLPARGKDIHELESELAKSPEMVDKALKKETGQVTMPTFHFVFEQDFRPQLEQMGLQKAFEDMHSMIRIRESHLTEVKQSVDFQLDKQGIRASAETVTGALYGGIMIGKPFRMQIDRPFLFLVRDYNANALLFLGAVMDPAEKR
jgi:serpin B